jgi:organic radical activating enzyme
MFEQEKKHFPIKQQPACQLKWTWSTLWLTEGSTNSCHRCERVPLQLENFDNFHNLSHKIKEREIMLSGKWPTKENGGSGHCEFCKKVEDAGGFSDRMQHLTIPNLSPKELDTDLTATKVTPKILEVFMNATCNLKCTYCNTRDSSQWRSEAEKFGTLKNIDNTDMDGYGPRKNHPNTRKYFEKTLEWIAKNGHELRRLHLLGGETFYQNELQEMIDTLKKLKNKHLELNIVSNLMVKEQTFKKYIEQVRELIMNKNIGRFDLTASIDGWGLEAEYARSGLKCDHWEKLFSYAVNQKWMIINTNQTITSLTVRTIPQLLEIVKKYRRINPKIATHFSMVTGREWMHPSVFGRRFWEDDIKNILYTMPNDDERDIVTSKYMEGTFAQIPVDPDQKQIKNLKNFLDQIDHRRNTNWREVYPYLDI